MILVDTSVWVNHDRIFDPALAEIVTNGQLLCHDFIVGELAVGSIKDRKIFLGKLGQFNKIKKISDEIILEFIETHKLYATGLSYIDIHLLASCMLGKCKIYSLDKKLVEFAKKLGVNY